MDSQALVNLIQGVGFPIACTVALFTILYNEMKDRRSRDAEFQKILSENTQAINRVIDLIRDKYNDK